MSVIAPQLDAPGRRIAGRKRFPFLLRFFEPAPPAAVMLTDPAQIRKQHRYWQRRVMIATIVGYAIFYFVRKNLSIAMPVMEKTLGVTKTDLGLFLTLHGVLYGVSKFVNGFFGDRCNVRMFMVTGLVLSAVVMILLPLSYGGIIAATGYGVYQYAHSAYSFFAAQDNSVLMLVGYGGPLLAGNRRPMAGGDHHRFQSLHEGFRGLGAADVRGLSSAAPSGSRAGRRERP